MAKPDFGCEALKIVRALMAACLHAKPVDDFPQLIAQIDALLFQCEDEGENNHG